MKYYIFCVLFGHKFINGYEYYDEMNRKWIEEKSVNFCVNCGLNKSDIFTNLTEEK